MISDPFLKALLETLIPADAYPSGWEAGGGDYLRHQLESNAYVPTDWLRKGLAQLDEEAKAQFGQGFAALDAQTRTDLLTAVQQNDVQTIWKVPPNRFFPELLKLVMAGYYSNPENGGNKNGRSWEMVGFRPGPAAEHLPITTPALEGLQETAVSAIGNEYDAIVIGAGAAGGIVAATLAEAGKKVLLVEKGRLLRYGDVSNDHLRNHRLALYGHNTGPEREGHPRIYIDHWGHAQRVFPHENHYFVTIQVTNLWYKRKSWKR